jgi:hypothetical protein
MRPILNSKTEPFSLCRKLEIDEHGRRINTEQEDAVHPKVISRQFDKRKNIYATTNVQIT